MKQSKPRLTIPLGRYLSESALGSDHQTLYTLAGETLETFTVWDIRTGRLLQETLVPDDSTLSTDGEAFVVIEPKQIVVQNSRTERVLGRIPVPDAPNMVALSPDKTKVIAIWWWKPETTLFDLATRRRLWTRKESLPFPEFHPDNKRLLCRKGFDLFLLDVGSGATLAKGSIYGAIEDIGTIAFSPFGYQIAVGDLRQSAFIFGTTTLEAQDSYDFEALVNTVCFLPDSKRVLIGGRKPQIDVLDPASRNFVESWGAEMKIVQDIFLTKDGKTLVIVGFRTKSTGRDADAVADIWDLKTFLPK